MSRRVNELVQPESDSHLMDKIYYCELCGYEVDGIEQMPHINCIRLETMRNNYSIMALPDADEEAGNIIRKRDGLYVWVTWLSRLMAGESSCQWASWFKTHFTGYEKVAPDFQLAVWVAQHTQMVDQLAKEHSALGETILREEQTSFKVRRGSGLLIAGRPDLITISGAGQHKVHDAKTGNRSNSHTIQVMLYMMLLPYSQEDYKGKEFDGCVIYKDGNRCDVPAAVIDNDFRNQVTYFLDILEAPAPPEQTPSFGECKFCDISNTDCPARIQTNVPKFINGAEPEIPF